MRVEIDAVIPRRVAILQSNYIPWKGYFDMMDSVDDFVLFDTAQYTKGDWRNRNRIKTQAGPAWLTVPVLTAGRHPQRICDTATKDESWRARHLARLSECYRHAHCYRAAQPFVADLYETCPPRWLSEINRHFIEGICGLLGIGTRLWSSSDFELPEGRSERLLAICRKLGATDYVSGPAAKGYLDETIFKRDGISISWFEYAGYPEYQQVYPPFDHAVTVLDPIFHLGPNAGNAILRRQAGMR